MESINKVLEIGDFFMKKVILLTMVLLLALVSFNMDSSSNVFEEITTEISVSDSTFNVDAFEKTLELGTFNYLNLEIDSGGNCSDPDSNDRVEKRWVNGRAQFVLIVHYHLMLASFEFEQEVEISAATANEICYGWNNQ